MRKLLILLPLLVLPVSALAQTKPATPHVEIFGGYSFLLANQNNSSFNMNGANFSVAENMNSWFGGALDFSSHWGTENGYNVNTQSITFGPVFTYRKNKTVVPFGHIMLGAARGSPQYLNISQSEWRFATYAGGGVDVNVNSRIAVRLIQADYLMTRFSDIRQDNFRFSAGVVFKLGKRK